MAMLTTWMRSSFGTYFDNATSRRDYRAQLRGSRSIILWTVYLLALIGICMINYASSVSVGTVSIVEAQRSLSDFYHLVMILLAAMIVLVAPALAATAIVVEKERRSLDLVFSAPVKPKTLLVGKMISAYRYVWMLLVLSLPVTAVCVVLGGATWGEVLAAYALLSLHALLYSGVALTISSLANKPVGALVWTYIAIGIYNIVAVSIAGVNTLTSSFGGPTNEAPFTITLSPFLAYEASGTHTTIFSTHVPNWILFGVYVLFLTRLLLLGAASSLSPFNSWETKNLRLTAAVAMGLLGFLLGYVLFTSFAPSPGRFGGMPSSYSPNLDLIAANLLAFLPLILLVPLPFITCSGIDGERKYLPNGAFSLKEAIRGTPAGALPFMLMAIAFSAAGIAVAEVMFATEWPAEIFLSTIAWSIGFWVFCWSLGRWASATSVELKSARTLHLASLIVLLGLPIPFLAIVDPEQQTPLWTIYPLYPLWMQTPDPSFGRAAMGVALLLVGAVIAYAANRKVKARDAVPPVIT